MEGHLMIRVILIILLNIPLRILAEDKVPEVMLSKMEEEMQPPFYLEDECDKLLDLCKYDKAGVYSKDGAYDFTHPNCVANNISLPPKDNRRVPLMKERRMELEFAINTVGDFIKRLERPWEFIIQVIVFVIPLGFGIYLYLVGHFQFKNVYDPYASDPTRGMPGWQYLRMKYAAIKVLDSDSFTKRANTATAKSTTGGDGVGVEGGDGTIADTDAEALWQPVRETNNDDFD